MPSPTSGTCRASREVPNNLESMTGGRGLHSPSLKLTSSEELASFLDTSSRVVVVVVVGLGVVN